MSGIQDLNSISALSGSDQFPIYNTENGSPRKVSAATARAFFQGGAVAQVFDTKSEAVAGIASIGEDQLVTVLNDETPGQTYTNHTTVYRNQGGTLVFQRDLEQVRTDLANSAAGFGASMVAFSHSMLSAANTVAGRLKRFVCITDAPFNAKLDGITDDRAAIQAALDLVGVTGGTVVHPAGNALVLAGLLIKSNVLYIGQGMESSSITTPNDIEVFSNDRTNINTVLFGAEIRDLKIEKTISGATTKYDIRFSNAEFCRLHKVHVKSGHNDAAYSETNVGGVLMERLTGSTTPAFCNTVEDCWIQNNSIMFDGVTDSEISRGFVWGHVRQFAIRIRGGGNIAIVGVQGIITSQFNGGIWLDGPGVNQIRILNNEFDGNPSLIRGDGIFCPQLVVNVKVVGNTIWACGRNGINVTDPVGWTITGNGFYQNNADDNFYDDIRITGQTFSPNGNVVCGNSHIADIARTNKGYMIREVNGGNPPVNNTYTGNGSIGGNYLTPGILILLTASAAGNIGAGSPDVSRSPGMYSAFGSNSLIAELVASGVANGSAISLPINTETFGGQPGGFVGTVNVSSTRENDATRSTRTVFAVVCRGTVSTFTPLVTQDGSTAPAAFVVDTNVAGTIRFINNGGGAVTVRLSFVGSKSLA